MAKWSGSKVSRQARGRWGRIVLAGAAAVALMQGMAASAWAGSSARHPTYYSREEEDGSVSFTDSPTRYSGWSVFIQGRSRSGSRFRDYAKNFYLYDESIRVLSREQAVPPSLVKAIVMAESAFNPEARSSAGAQGLMQLIPSTARRMGVSDPWDPQDNLMGGTRYIKQMLTRFNGDTRLAVAAYNAGPEAVDRYKGIPPYAETQEYVRRVEALYEQFRRNDLSFDKR